MLEETNSWRYFDSITFLCTCQTGWRGLTIRGFTSWWIWDNFPETRWWELRLDVMALWKTWCLIESYFVWVGSDCKNHLFLIPLPWEECHPLDRVAQDLFQPVPEYFQGWGLSQSCPIGWYFTKNSFPALEERSRVGYSKSQSFSYMSLRSVSMVDSISNFQLKSCQYSTGSNSTLNKARASLWLCRLFLMALRTAEK